MLRKILLLFLLVIYALVNSFVLVTAQVSSPTTVFLPLIRNGSDWAENKFIGIYLPYFLNENNINTAMPKADQAAGKKHSVLGWFIDLEDDNPAYNLTVQLESAWKEGYISFVNLGSTRTAEQIASGAVDPQIDRLANAYAAWLGNGGGRIAFLSPLQEMNGDWVSYGKDPANFISAYKRIQNRFSMKGITRSQAWWVFAPNGWSESGHEFEKYYPGDAFVDAVGFSSYNYGFCSVAYPWQTWATFDQVFTPYINRMTVMAPGKPIIIAQTATTAEYSRQGEVNRQKKDEWLFENYRYLASEPAVMGILYFDFNNSWECDFRITQIDQPFAGYKQGVLSSSNYKYLSVEDLTKMRFGQQ